MSKNVFLLEMGAEKNNWDHLKHCADVCRGTLYIISKRLFELTHIAVLVSI